MPAGPMDAVGAFSYLTDNTPAWIDRVTDLVAYTIAKHAEYTEAYRQYATTARPRRRRKNSSVCSIHTDDLLQSAQNPDDDAGDLTQGKTEVQDSNPDAAASAGDPLVSTRHNVIIHYDGHTQKVLEDIVRNIVTARNNIRKGKMSQVPAMGFRSSRPTMPGHGPPDAVLSSIRSARNRAPPGPQKETALDHADKHLEVAHGLCESAAYQFLRAGDCKAELGSVEEKFRILFDMAGNEVQRLKEAQQQESPEPEAEKEETGFELPPSTVTSAAEPVTTSKPRASPTEAPAEAIEVDDASSVSMESIDLTAFRANRMNRMRA